MEIQIPAKLKQVAGATNVTAQARELSRPNIGSLVKLSFVGAGHAGEFLDPKSLEIAGMARSHGTPTKQSQNWHKPERVTVLLPGPYASGMTHFEPTGMYLWRVLEGVWSLSAGAPIRMTTQTLTRNAWQTDRTLRVHNVSGSHIQFAYCASFLAPIPFPGTRHRR